MLFAMLLGETQIHHHRYKFTLSVLVKEEVVSIMKGVKKQTYTLVVAAENGAADARR